MPAGNAGDRPTEIDGGRDPLPFPKASPGMTRTTPASSRRLLSAPLAAALVAWTTTPALPQTQAQTQPSVQTQAQTQPSAQAQTRAPAQPPAERLTVELNKFEEGEEGGCRAFFLFRNRTELALEDFELSLAVLDSRGTIDRLLTIDASPLPAARTTLKLFEIAEIGCGDISELLVHDVPSCRPQNAEEVDCFQFMDLASRASARLVK